MENKKKKYAKEIEREAPVFVKPDQAEKPAAPQAPDGAARP